MWLAIRDAIASVSAGGVSPEIDAPATPERILRAVDLIRSDGERP